MLLQRVNFLAIISSRIKYLEALLKCVLMEAIPECVTMGGITVTLQWCAVKWDSQDMVCQLLFPFQGLSISYFFVAGAIAIDSSAFPGSTLTPFVSSVSCIGDESNLFSCPLSSSAKLCDGEAKAGVACQGLLQL